MWTIRFAFLSRFRFSPSFFNRKFSTMELSAVVVCFQISSMPQYNDLIEHNVKSKLYMQSCIMDHTQSKHERFLHPSRVYVEWLHWAWNVSIYSGVSTIWYCDYNNWNGIYRNLWQPLMQNGFSHFMTMLKTNRAID